MVEFKARLPPIFNPFISNFTRFSEWREEFNVYISASTVFADTVDLPTQQAHLFNIAGADFMKYVKQHITVAATTTITVILDAVGIALKPTCFDLQNHENLFNCTQGAGMPATKFLQEIRDLYSLSGYPDAIPKETVIRDLFISGVVSIEAKRLLFQADSDTLTLAHCLTLVASFESVQAAPLVPEPPAPDLSVSLLQKSDDRFRRLPNAKCYGCGQQPAHHQHQSCLAFKLICHSCGKQGYFAKVCHNSVVSSVATDDLDSDPFKVSSVSELNPRRRCLLPIKINSQVVAALVDSGSDVTVISEAIAKHLNLGFSLPSKPFQRMMAAGGTNLTLVGLISDACLETPQGYLIDDVWVAANLTSSAILGQSSLSAFETLTIHFGGKLPILNVRDISIDNQSTFATHMPVSCFLQLDHTSPAIWAPSRCQSTDDKVFMRAEIQRLLRFVPPILHGIVNLLSSMSQPTQKPRMVIDYAQMVNHITPLDTFPIPLVTDLLDTVSRFTVFSYIDLKATFHQFEIDSSECYLTAFEADGRLFEFNCIPFSLRNSLAVFSRALQDLIGHLPGLVVYLDDVVIGGSTLAEHDANLRTFLKVASEVGLALSADKCTLHGSQLRFLGHIVKNGTIYLDLERSAPFRNFPVPSTAKELERFIGLAVYHSKWVPKFSHVMDPLFEALKNQSLSLLSAAVKAIDQVKDAIHQAILFVPEPNKPLSLSTNASGTAIVAILSQEGWPVAFMSRHLSPSQRHWSLAELKGFAVVQACSQFWHYLSNRPFTVFCDQHGFVQVLNSASTRGVKNTKFTRWHIELAEFDFSIQHIPGVCNTAADALSQSVASIQSMSPNFQLVQSRHVQYGHPGRLRLGHLLRVNGDSDLISNVEEECHMVISNCHVCAEVKP